jgi:raffinose/stachyose/melibiose transport system substrate-binding protein
LKKTVKGVALTAALALTVTSLPMMASAAGKTQIIVAAGKFEIAQQFKDMESVFEKDNPTIDLVVETPRAGDTVGTYDKLVALGKTPTVAMVEPGTLFDKFQGQALDLSKEKWNKDTNSAFKDDKGRVVGFPFTVEGFGIVFNRKVVEKAIGGKFNEQSIKTYDQLKALFDKVKASGIKYPVAYQTEAWSVGNHYISQIMNQTANPLDTKAQLESGKMNLNGNATFNGLLKTMDLLASKTYNVYGASPLGKYYDDAHVRVGKGTSAFLFNGNWAYDSLKASSGDDFGFIAVPVGNNPNNRVNGKVTAGPTQIMFINNKEKNAKKIAAAKTFLNWLVYNKHGQDFIVNKSQCISAFKNNPYKVTNPLGKNLSKWIAAGKTLPFSTNYVNPGDYFNKIGPAVQKYIAKKISSARLAKVITDYHKENGKKANNQ